MFARLFVLFCGVSAVLSETVVDTDGTLGNRIIGGEPARSGQFPFAVAANVTKADGYVFCGGSLLNEQWILTAATCIYGAQKALLRIGSNHLNDDTNVMLAVTTRFTIHPDFDPITQNNNIGLIKLYLPIVFTEYIAQIYLPTTDVDWHTNVTIVGWGQTSDYNTTLEELNTARLISIPNYSCWTVYPDKVTKNTVCASGNANEGTCIGDLGGPLIYYLNGRHATQVGIASFLSENGCEAFEPSGYTRTYPYIDWILETAQIQTIT